MCVPVLSGFSMYSTATLYHEDPNKIHQASWKWGQDFRWAASAASACAAATRAAATCTTCTAASSGCVRPASSAVLQVVIIKGGRGIAEGATSQPQVSAPTCQGTWRSQICNVGSPEAGLAATAAGADAFTCAGSDCPEPTGQREAAEAGIGRLCSAKRHSSEHQSQSSRLAVLGKLGSQGV